MKPLTSSEHMGEIGFFRGLNYAPGDCDGLEHVIGRKLWIPDIPLYDGHLPPDTDRRVEEERLARKIAEEVIERRCRRFIAHSRGTFMALLAAQLADEKHCQVEWIAMIPAAADPRTIPLKENADAMDDAILFPLCRTMATEKYLTLRNRHAPGLKKALKVMDPKKYAVPVEDVRKKAFALNSDVRIFVIDCEHDPFRDLRRLDAMLGGRLNVTISTPLSCGHFPHIECPDELMETIKEWQETLRTASRTLMAPAV